MTLLDRYHANQCAYVECDELRTRDSALCGRHLVDLQRNLLDRLPDNTYGPRRRFVARDLTDRRVVTA